ncbi:MAG: ABC transporter permease [Motilibacteraceae bacterium]
MSITSADVGGDGDPQGDLAATEETGRRRWVRRKPADRRQAHRQRDLVLSVVAVLIGFLVWQLAATRSVSALLPAPAEVAHRAVDLARTGRLQDNLLASLGRVCLGFALGVLVAIPAGFAMGWYSSARAVIEPYVQFFRTIPPLALIPLVILLLGIGEAAKVFVIFLAVFLACVIATFQGVVSVDRTLINAARVLGARDSTVFLRVVIPASTPFILVGMRIGLGSAWATLVAAELIAAQSGLGRMMQEAQLYLDVPTIMVGLLGIGICGFVMDRLLLVLQNRLTRWQETR